MKVRPIFAWYDLWVGVFVDRPKRRFYIFPLPCIGVMITWAAGGELCREGRAFDWPEDDAERAFALADAVIAALLAASYTEAPE